LPTLAGRVDGTTVEADTSPAKEGAVIGFLAVEELVGGGERGSGGAATGRCLGRKAFRGEIRRERGEFASFRIRIGLGIDGTTQEQVHTDDGLAESPEPIAAGEPGFNEECTGHGAGSAPLTLNGAILRLPVGWSRADANPFAKEKGMDFTFDKTRVKIAAYPFRNPPGICKETPEGVDEGGGCFGTKSVHPGVAGSQVN
jgi:hypothetical protein